jgi:hypothetical protein
MIGKVPMRTRHVNGKTDFFSSLPDFELCFNFAQIYGGSFKHPVASTPVAMTKSSPTSRFGRLRNFFGTSGDTLTISSDVSRTNSCKLSGKYKSAITGLLSVHDFRRSIDESFVNVNRLLFALRAYAYANSGDSLLTQSRM